MQIWQVDPEDGQLRWTVADIPQPEPGQTIVRVASAGICGSDIAKLAKAVIPTPPGRPWRPGHEIAGWVAGIPVAVDPLVTCGVCERCITGRVNACPDLQMIGWHLPGGFAPYVAAPTANVVALPANLTEDVAVLAEPTAVAVHGVRCGLRPGRTLAVIGSGALAVASAVYAASRGWKTELLVRNPAKLADADLPVRVRPLELLPLRQYDAVVDAAGGADDSAFTAALDAVVDHGQVVVQTAYHPGVKLTCDLRDIVRRGLTITSSFSFCRAVNSGDFVEALAFLAADHRWTTPFVGNRYWLQDLPRVLQELDAPSGVRPVKAVLTVAAGD